MEDDKYKPGGLIHRLWNSKTLIAQKRVVPVDLPKNGLYMLYSDQGRFVGLIRPMELVDIPELTASVCRALDETQQVMKSELLYKNYIGKETVRYNNPDGYRWDEGGEPLYSAEEKAYIEQEYVPTSTEKWMATYMERHVTKRITGIWGKLDSDTAPDEVSFDTLRLYVPRGRLLIWGVYTWLKTQKSFHKAMPLFYDNFPAYARVFIRATGVKFPVEWINANTKDMKTAPTLGPKQLEIGKAQRPPIVNLPDEIVHIINRSTFWSGVEPDIYSIVVKPGKIKTGALYLAVVLREIFLGGIGTLNARRLFSDKIDAGYVSSLIFSKQMYRLVQYFPAAEIFPITKIIDQFILDFSIPKSDPFIKQFLRQNTHKKMRWIKESALRYSRSDKAFYPGELFSTYPLEGIAGDSRLASKTEAELETYASQKSGEILHWIRLYRPTVGKFVQRPVIRATNMITGGQTSGKSHYAVNPEFLDNFIAAPHYSTFCGALLESPLGTFSACSTILHRIYAGNPFVYRHSAAVYHDGKFIEVGAAYTARTSGPEWYGDPVLNQRERRARTIKQTSILTRISAWDLPVKNTEEISWVDEIARSRNSTAYARKGEQPTPISDELYVQTVGVESLRTTALWRIFGNFSQNSHYTGDDNFGQQCVPAAVFFILALNAKNIVNLAEEMDSVLIDAYSWFTGNVEIDASNVMSVSDLPNHFEYKGIRYSVKFKDLRPLPFPRYRAVEDESWVEHVATKLTEAFSRSSFVLMVSPDIAVSLFSRITTSTGVDAYGIYDPQHRNVKTGLPTSDEGAAIWFGYPTIGTLTGHVVGTIKAMNTHTGITFYPIAIEARRINFQHGEMNSAGLSAAGHDYGASIKQMIATDLRQAHSTQTDTAWYLALSDITTDLNQGESLGEELSAAEQIIGSEEIVEEEIITGNITSIEQLTEMIEPATTAREEDEDVVIFDRETEILPDYVDSEEEESANVTDTVGTESDTEAGNTVKEEVKSARHRSRNVTQISVAQINRALRERRSRQKYERELRDFVDAAVYKGYEEIWHFVVGKSDVNPQPSLRCTTIIRRFLKSKFKRAPKDWSVSVVQEETDMNDIEYGMARILYKAMLQPTENLRLTTANIYTLGKLRDAVLAVYSDALTKMETAQTMTETSQTEFPLESEPDQEPSEEESTESKFAAEDEERYKTEKSAKLMDPSAWLNFAWIVENRPYESDPGTGGASSRIQALYFAFFIGGKSTLPDSVQPRIKNKSDLRAIYSETTLNYSRNYNKITSVEALSREKFQFFKSEYRFKTTQIAIMNKGAIYEILSEAFEKSDCLLVKFSDTLYATCARFDGGVYGIYLPCELDSSYLPVVALASNKTSFSFWLGLESEALLGDYLRDVVSLIHNETEFSLFPLQITASPGPVLTLPTQKETIATVIYEGTRADKTPLAYAAARDGSFHAALLYLHYTFTEPNGVVEKVNLDSSITGGATLKTKNTSVDNPPVKIRGTENINILPGQYSGRGSVAITSESIINAFMESPLIVAYTGEFYCAVTELFPKDDKAAELTAKFVESKLASTTKAKFPKDKKRSSEKSAPAEKGKQKRKRKISDDDDTDQEEIKKMTRRTINPLQQHTINAKPTYSLFLPVPVNDYYEIDRLEKNSAIKFTFKSLTDLVKYWCEVVSPSPAMVPNNSERQQNPIFWPVIFTPEGASNPVLWHTDRLFMKWLSSTKKIFSNRLSIESTGHLDTEELVSRITETWMNLNGGGYKNTIPLPSLRGAVAFFDSKQGRGKFLRQPLSMDYDYDVGSKLDAFHGVLNQKWVREICFESPLASPAEIFRWGYHFSEIKQPHRDLLSQSLAVKFGITDLFDELEIVAEYVDSFAKYAAGLKTKMAKKNPHAVKNPAQEFSQVQVLAQIYFVLNEVLTRQKASVKPDDVTEFRHLFAHWISTSEKKNLPIDRFYPFTVLPNETGYVSPKKGHPTLPFFVPADLEFNDLEGFYASVGVTNLKRANHIMAGKQSPSKIYEWNMRTTMSPEAYAIMVGYMTNQPVPPTTAPTPVAISATVNLSEPTATMPISVVNPSPITAVTTVPVQEIPAPIYQPDPFVPVFKTLEPNVEISTAIGFILDIGVKWVDFSPDKSEKFKGAVMQWITKAEENYSYPYPLAKWYHFVAHGLSQTFNQCFHPKKPKGELPAVYSPDNVKYTTKIPGRGVAVYTDTELICLIIENAQIVADIYYGFKLLTSAPSHCLLYLLSRGRTDSYKIGFAFLPTTPAFIVEMKTPSGHEHSEDIFGKEKWRLRQLHWKIVNATEANPVNFADISAFNAAFRIMARSFGYDGGFQKWTIGSEFGHPASLSGARLFPNILDLGHFEKITSGASVTRMDNSTIWVTATSAVGVLLQAIVRF